MKKAARILFALVVLFGFFILINLHKGNYSIFSYTYYNHYAIIFLFITGLGLVFINEFCVKLSGQEKIITHFSSGNKLSALISVIVSCFLFFFMCWLIYRSHLISLSVTIFLFSSLITLWLFISKIKYSVSIVGIVILAISLRLIWSLTVQTQPISDFYVYWAQAQSVFIDVDPFQTKAPFVIIFYGIVHFIFGNSLWAVYIVNSFLGGVQVWLIYKIANFIAPHTLSPKISALLYTIYPTSIFFSSVVSSEAPAITMILCSTYLLFKKLHLDGSVSNYKWYKNFILISAISLCISGAYLSRNTSIVLLPASIVTLLFFSQKKMSKKIWDAFMLQLIFFIFMSPLLISNFQQYGEISVASGKMFGVSLLSGVSKATDGGYDVKKLEEIMLDLGLTGVNPQQKNVVHKVSQRAKQEAINIIQQDKLGFVIFAMTDKFNRMWVGDSSVLNWAIFGSKVFEKGKHKKILNMLFKICSQYYLALWFLALCSILFLPFKKELIPTNYARKPMALHDGEFLQRNTPFIKPGYFISFSGSVIILTFVLHFFYEAQSRYHMPVMPFVCIMASYFLSGSFIGLALPRSKILNTSSMLVE